MHIHHFIHNDDGKRLERIENLLVKIIQKGDKFMSAMSDALAAIDQKTDSIAADVAAERTTLADIQKMVADLQANASNPADVAAAQAIAAKISGVETNLAAVETDLGAVGKSPTP